MAFRVEPGTNFPFVLRDLVNPGSGYVTSDATVTFDLIDAAGTTQATGTGSNSGGVNGADWSATLAIPDAEGTYTLRVTIDYGGEKRYQEETVDVRAFLNRGGTTLRDLRRMVGRRLGDLIVCTATEASANGGIFYDARNLRRSDNQYKGSQAWCALGAASNVGRGAAVTGSTQKAASVSLAPAFDAAFAPGDVLELHDDRGMGWGAEEKHDAINRALLLAASMGGTERTATLTAAFDADEPLIKVPSAFQAVYAVEWQTDDGEWRRVQKAGKVGGQGWRARRDGTLEVLGTARREMDGKTVRLWGFGDHDVLTDDQDATLVLAKWVVAEACYDLLIAGDRKDDTRRHWLPEFRREADMWRRAAVRQRPPDTAIVRNV